MAVDVFKEGFYKNVGTERYMLEMLRKLLRGEFGTKFMCL